MAASNDDGDDRRRSSSSSTSLARELLHRLPSAGLSRAFGRLSEVKLPPRLQGRVNRAFARFAGIDLEESELPPEAYPTLNAFFTRNLRAGAREIHPDSSALVSPVDGRLSSFGAIGDQGTLIQAKGRTYRLDELLAHDPDVERFEGGAYATIYLSPRDYHRIHSPVDGEVVAMAYTPGALLPVNRLGVQYVQDLFPRNERLTSFIETNAGQLVALCKVGATCVGRISVAYDPFLTNQPAALRHGFRREFVNRQPVERGSDLAAFNLGSTVVLAMEGRDFMFEPGLQEGQPVRLGQLLGHWTGER